MTGARRWLLVIVTLHVALGAVYAAATPIFETPDEGHHVGFIEWLRRGNGLPVQDPVRDRVTPTLYAQEGSQPPLFYVLAALATAAMPTDDFEIAHAENPLSRIGQPATTHNVNSYRPQTVPGDTWRLVMTLRAALVLMGGVTVWLVGYLAERVSGRWAVGLLAASVAAFNPMLVFINASVSNDNLVIVLNTAALTLGAYVALSGRSARKRDLIGLGLLLGAAALTKLSGLVVWPIAAAMLAVPVWSASAEARGLWRTQASGLLRQWLGVFGIAVIVCGWWYVRNVVLYGEVFGTNTMVAIAGPRAIGLVELIAQEWYGFFLSFWAVFGVFTILAPEWVYTFVSALTLAAIVGGVWALGASVRSGDWRRPTPARLIGVALAMMAALTLAALIRWTQQTYASQGRLMFGAIAPLALGLAYGWWALADRLHVGRAVWVVPIALAALALCLPVAVIAPRYRPPATVVEADLPQDFQRIDARLGDALDLLGVAYDPAPRHPGDSVAFTLYWRAEAPLTHDDSLALVVYGRDETVVSLADTWPGGGLLPPANMIPGAIYADAYTLPVTRSAAAPTVLTLRVGLWRDRPEERLPSTTRAGEPIPDPVLTVGRLVAAVPETPPGDGQPLTSWGGVSIDTASVRLRGARLTADGSLTLWWEGGGTPADQTLFLHLLDAQGRQVDQADGPTLDGAWPLTAWVMGAPFSERRRFNSVTTPLEGAYSLRLGWYDPATGARLPAWRPDGTRWPDDAALIKVQP